jgi:hypothetical protein
MNLVRVNIDWLIPAEFRQIPIDVICINGINGHRTAMTSSFWPKTATKQKQGCL